MTRTRLPAGPISFCGPRPNKHLLRTSISTNAGHIAFRQGALLRDNLDENERQSGFEAAVGSEVMIALGPEVCKPFSLAPAF